MPDHVISDDTLTIPDPEAFGFDGADLDRPDFTVVANDYVRARRTYNIHRLVMRHQETGRFYAHEYSTHESEGFEWGPGQGRDAETTWREVFAREVTTIVYGARVP